MLLFNCTYCQDVPDEVEIENMAERSETITEDDSHWEELKNYHRHPLNINRVTEAELNQLGIVSNVQVHNFISYRSLLGKLVHLNELQAVPGWTTDLVRKLLPYITVEDNEVNFQNLWTRWNKGHYFFLTRGSQQLKMAAPTNSVTAENYAGGPQHLLFRFQYSFGNLLSYGVLLEKDAGETLFGKRGFDFYSFHLFLRRVGIFKRLAIGDFTVKMGEGLIQWQGMGETKSANVLSIKRQREIIAPYHSPGEFEFYRGVAFSIEKKKWELNCFGSIRRLTATLNADSIGKRFVSSILTSGYHRTS